MEITGISLSLLEMPAEYTQEYNRWHDLDHVVEHLARPGVVAGRRYVAPIGLQGLDGVQTGELGHPPYAMIYFFGGAPDFASEEAAENARATDRRLNKEGRFWRPGSAPYSALWRLVSAVARPSVLVSPAAVPHLAHRGIIIALGRAPSADQYGKAVTWWEQSHVPDLMAVPGLLAAMRFEGVDASQSEQLLHVLLCEDPPELVMAGIEQVKRTKRATGRYPAFGGVYESLAFLPYQRVIPLQYDFQVGD